MYVSEIVIEGFKSFANKTVLPLNKNLNIIIGPNGSGKSNIIDAISFVLGESSRNLRADKGVNLIYNGPKSIGKAIVSLVIDLEDDYPEEVKEYFDEEVLKEKKIILTRTIKKSGESSYFVNNQKVSKQHFVKILNVLRLNTPYNIIFQGDITNIVKSSPIEKRKIFEELVNISYFEQKKEKVKKELDNVQLKLSELQAVLREKEKHLEELRKEKEKAELYLSLEKEKNRLLKAEYLNRLKEIDKKINELNNLDISLNTKISQLSLKKKNLQEEIKNLERKIEEINEKIKREGGVNIKELEERKIELLKEKERLKAEVEKISEELSKINKEIEELEGKKKRILSEIINLEKEKKSLSLKIKEKEKELESLKIDADFGSLEEFEKEIEKIKDEINELRSKKLLLEEKIKNVPSLNESFDIDEELDKLRQEESRLAMEFKTIQSLISEKEQKIFELRKKFEEEMNEVMQDRLIKRILELKKEIPDLYGPIFMLGRTKEEFKKALEMAAGPRMRAIVVENEDVAKEVIKVLKAEKLGIMSFIPLNRIKPKFVNPPNDEGVIGVASDLIEYNPKFDKAFKYVFGDTIVVRDFETAKRIGIGNYRMVTLDGEVFEVSGVITGGYQRRRQSFIDFSIEDKIKNLELEIESLKNRLDEVRKEREKLAEKIFELRIKKKEIEKNKELLENLNKIKDEIRSIEEEIREKEKILEERERKYKEIRNKLDNIMQAVKERERLLNEMNELRKNLAVVEEKLNSLVNSEEEIKKRLEELYKLDKELVNKNLELNEKLKVIENEEEKVSKELERFSQKVKDLIIEKEKAIKEINQKSKEIIKVEEEIQEIEKVKYQVEIKRQMLIDERNEVVRLINEIKEEPLFIENLEERLKEILAKLKELKHINFSSIEKFKEVEKEYNELYEKVKKVEEERNKIISVIAEIEEAKRKEFLKAFETINNNFKRIYKELLEKGEAWLELTDKENIFEGGIEIKVKLNNRIFNLKSLSGGEQSLVALSLIFAIQEFKPGTFYVFDEVDAALDKRNSRKLGKYLKKYSQKTQFIVISHNEEVIIEADYLFGVSMNKKTGISKVVSLDLTDTSMISKITQKN